MNSNVAGVMAETKTYQKNNNYYNFPTLPCKHMIPKSMSKFNIKKGGRCVTTKVI